MCSFGALALRRTHCLLQQPLGPHRNFKVLYRQSFAGPPHDISALGANIDAIGDTARRATQARRVSERAVRPALRVVRSRWWNGIARKPLPPGAAINVENVEPIALACRHSHQRRSRPPNSLDRVFETASTERGFVCRHGKV